MDFLPKIRLKATRVPHGQKQASATAGYACALVRLRRPRRVKTKGILDFLPKIRLKATRVPHGQKQASATAGYAYALVRLRRPKAPLRETWGRSSPPSMPLPGGGGSSLKAR